MTALTLAISKGRILQEALPLLRHAGMAPVADPEKTRKLIFETAHPQVRLLIVRAADVPPYVEYGGADLGVVGKDVLDEYHGAGLYQPLDLGIARCRMMVAGRPEVLRRLRTRPHQRVRVATKYVNTARRHFARTGQQIELIKLYGSMELAPLVGMADLIVDLVSTGDTLKANGLVPLEHIGDISSRLVVNKAAMKTRYDLVQRLLTQLGDAVRCTDTAEADA